MERAGLREIVDTAIRSAKKRLNDRRIRFQVSGNGVFAKADAVYWKKESVL